jgi:bifunctional DNA-binding transcriptional regulator/antitoxin component of YhaV-PrlF toxin-antitoxin module
VVKLVKKVGKVGNLEWLMADLNTCKMSSKGQITISSNARKQLGLKPEARLLEVVVNNCILLIPQDEVLHDVMKKAHDNLKAAGITADRLIAGVGKRRDARVKRKYPELFNE